MSPLYGVNLQVAHKIKEKLYIIGDGPSKNNLKELVKEKNLEDKILLLGKKNNPFVWMKNAEIFILSSKFEGFGLVLVEAIAVETFVISSKCRTGPTEILRNGKCGDLFEVGNIVELSNKINYVLKNTKYKIHKINLASKRIEEFKQKNIINELIIILDDLTFNQQVQHT